MDAPMVVKLIRGGETPAVEFKREVWLDKVERDSGDEFIKPLDRKRKAEFAKDAMALANTFSYWGVHRYMLIGVDDDGTIVGLSPENATEQMMAQVLKDLCYPPVGFEWQFVTLSSDEPVVVLKIPDSCLKPHHLTQSVEYKEIKGKTQRTHTYSCETVWIRRGSHCHRAMPEEIYKLKCEAQSLTKKEQPRTVPDRNQWMNYLNRVIQKAGEYEVDDSIPLVALNQDNQSVSPSEIVRQFLSDSEDRVMFIVGRPGIGKTVLANHVARDLALDALQDLSDGYSYPRTIIPIFMSMNGYKSNEREVSNAISIRFLVWLFGRLLNLDKYKGKGLEGQIAELLLSRDLTSLRQWSSPAELLQIPEFKFVVFLDGLDEMNREGWEASLKQVQAFLRSGVKVIVTSREGVVAHRWIREICDKMITIQPLAESAIQQQFSRHLRYPDLAWDLVSQDSELVDLLRTPLAIQAALNYFQDIEADEEDREYAALPRTRGRLLDRVLTHVLDHDEKVDFGVWIIARAADRSEVLADLAFSMKGRQATSATTAREQLKEEYENLHNLCLLHREGRRIKFFNGLTQRFFFACKLQELYEEGQVDVSNLPDVEPAHLQDSLEILHEISFHDLVQRKEQEQ